MVQLAAPGPAVNGGPAGATGNEIRVAGSGLSMAGPTALLIQLESECQCPSQVSPVYASCAGDSSAVASFARTYSSLPGASVRSRDELRVNSAPLIS